MFKRARKFPLSESNKSSPPFNILFLYSFILILLPHLRPCLARRVCHSSLHTKTCMCFCSPHTTHTFWQFNPHWFYHTNNVLQTVQIMKFLIMLESSSSFSSSSFYYFPLRSKYLPTHHIIKHLQRKPTAE